VRPEQVVLVADAGLGTISQVRLATAALAPGGDAATLLVHLNRFDDTDELHRRNLDWLVTRDGLEVITSTAALAQRVRAGLLGTLSP
jgi:hypothetical protein